MSGGRRVAPARPRPVAARFPGPGSTTPTAPRPQRSFPPASVVDERDLKAHGGVPQRTLVRAHPHEVATVLLVDRDVMDLERLPELSREGRLADSEARAHRRR